MKNRSKVMLDYISSEYQVEMASILSEMEKNPKRASEWKDYIESRTIFKVDVSSLKNIVFISLGVVNEYEPLVKIFIEA